MRNERVMRIEALVLLGLGACTMGPDASLEGRASSKQALTFSAQPSPEAAKYLQGFTPRTDCPARSTPIITLPQDDAPHPVQSAEWWYYNAHLFTAEGHHLGVELVFYQYPSLSPPFAGTATTFAIADLSSDPPTFKQKNFSAPEAFPNTPARFELVMSDAGDTMLAVGEDGDDHLTASLEGYAIDLHLRSLKQPLLHGVGNGGAIPFPLGPDGYYSRTRMSAEGSVRVGHNTEPVTGIAWFDHQYGAAPAVDWNWFAIHLADGRDVMAYTWTAYGGLSRDASVTVSGADCNQTSYDASQVKISQRGAWTSQQSGSTYGEEFIIEVPSDDIQLTITPRLHAEVLPPTQPAYIEAPCDVVMTQHATQVRGLAYVEQIFWDAIQ